MIPITSNIKIGPVIKSRHYHPKTDTITIFNVFSDLYTLQTEMVDNAESELKRLYKFPPPILLDGKEVHLPIPLTDGVGEIHYQDGKVITIIINSSFKIHEELEATALEVCATKNL